MNTYITTRVKFNELTKKVNRIFKKLDAIGATYEFKELSSFVKRVPVYANDFTNHCTVKVNEVNVECVEYTLTFDPYKVGDYRFGAVVERSDDPNKNLVYVSDETVNFNDYMTATLRCEHCGTNHRRVRCAVLVDNKTNAHKMIGMTCLKDFIGYDVEQFYNYFKEIEQILLENTDAEIDEREFGKYKTCIDTREFLAYCIYIIRRNGYAKTVKEDALYNMKHDTKIDEIAYTEADKVIKFFANYETDDIFENDVRLFVTNKKPVTGANGFVAYAYVLYNKIIEKARIKAEDEARKEIATFVGNIGDKVEITGTLKRAGHYETQFGTVTIFKVIDKNNNVYVWKTATYVNINTDEIVTIKGTIKEQNEYKGEKQNVLTRCKVNGCAMA
jgi:hypothetical protein